MVIYIGNISVSSNCFIKIWIVYELKKQWTLLCIYNCRMIFLCIARLSYRNNNDLQCYNFTYSQYPILVSASSHVISHLRILFCKDRESLRIILCFLIWHGIYFTLNVKMIEECNHPQYIEIISLMRLYTKSN